MFFPIIAHLLMTGGRGAVRLYGGGPNKVSPVKAIRRFTVRVTLPEPLAALLGLMLNLRWSWHAPTAELFASIDPDAWQAAGGDPIAMLSAVPPERMTALAGDPDFLARLHEAERGLRDYMSGPRWYADAGQTKDGT